MDGEREQDARRAPWVIGSNIKTQIERSKMRFNRPLRDAEGSSHLLTGKAVEYTRRNFGQTPV